MSLSRCLGQQELQICVRRYQDVGVHVSDSGSCLFVAHETYVSPFGAATRVHLRHNTTQADINLSLLTIVVSAWKARQEPQATGLQLRPWRPVANLLNGRGL